MKQSGLVLLLNFLLFNLGYSQKQAVENLVFEGAGIRGIAYCGVIQEMEKAGMISGIRKCGGTSAGAITALMISLGYNSSEINEIISGTRFEKFNDGEYLFVGGLSRLKHKYGWYKGDEFTIWLGKIIEKKTGNADITFTQLQDKGFKDLYITATCLNKQRLFVFSKETYPQMKIRDAVRISMSIPLYFEAVFIDRDGKVYEEQREARDLDLVIDGGIIGNFPIFLFDSTYTNSKGETIRVPNNKTLGIRIDSDQQIQYDAAGRELAPAEISSISDYLTAFYHIVLENLNRSQLIPEDWDRTISVSSTGISPRIKKLSDDEKKKLVHSGETAAKAYFMRN
jgi:NTE family protein